MYWMQEITSAKWLPREGVPLAQKINVYHSFRVDLCTLVYGSGKKSVHTNEHLNRLLSFCWADIRHSHVTIVNWQLKIRAKKEINFYKKNDNIFHIHTNNLWTKVLISSDFLSLRGKMRWRLRLRKDLGCRSTARIYRQNFVTKFWVTSMDDCAATSGQNLYQYTE